MLDAFSEVRLKIVEILFLKKNIITEQTEKISALILSEQNELVYKIYLSVVCF